MAEAGDGLEAIQIVERLKPDILVLDLMMPGLGGLEVTRQVRQLSPQTQVVILSMHADEAYVVEALRAGAIAYVLKKSTSDALGRAIREAIDGRHFLSPPLSERALETYRKRATGGLDPYRTLTTREREVLQMAAEGLTSAEIAARLSISPRTVEMHRSNLMRKLQLGTHSQLVRYAVKRGLLPPEG